MLTEGDGERRGNRARNVDAAGKGDSLPLRARPRRAHSLSRRHGVRAVFARWLRPLPPTESGREMAGRKSGGHRRALGVLILAGGLAVALVFAYFLPGNSRVADGGTSRVMSAAAGAAAGSANEAAGSAGTTDAAKRTAAKPAPSVTKGYRLVGGDEFNGTSVDPKRWGIYDSPGDSGKGLRRPSQITESGGALTVTCTANGTTGGMMYTGQQRYGIWQTRVKMSVASRNVRPVLLLWPAELEWPVGGEVDYMEVSDPARKLAHGYLHYGDDNSHTESEVRVDLTKYNVFSVKWTKAGIFYYVNNVLWFADHDKSHQPPGFMQPTIQLDYSGGRATPATMTVDWMRIYK